MIKKNILDEIGRDQRLKGYCFRWSGNKDPNIVYSEFLLVMCEKTEQVLVDLKEQNKLNKYCRNVIYTLINSAGSTLNYKPSKKIQTTNIDYPIAIDEDQENLWQKALDKTLLEESYWYNTKMVQVYMECDCNYQEVSRRTGIPVYTIRRTINHIKEKAKENYNLLCKLQ